MGKPCQIWTNKHFLNAWTSLCKKPNLSPISLGSVGLKRRVLLDSSKLARNPLNLTKLLNSNSFRNWTRSLRRTEFLTQVRWMTRRWTRNSKMKLKSRNWWSSLKNTGSARSSWQIWQEPDQDPEAPKGTAKPLQVPLQGILGAQELKAISTKPSQTKTTL